ncbi:hypothetical protein ACFQDD_02080 [Halorubrum pallidum]|uniref:Uncharacterized protein n=1 Tax=Halorubrum pallidum TaxID=1526114 RepID=A0ABD5T0N9_9EURY
MSQALMEAVVESATEGDSGASSPFSVETGVFERFDARLEDLFWWEGPDGALYVSEDRNQPPFAMEIAVEGTELTVEVVDEPTFGRDYQLISRPGSDANPQYD